MLCTTCAYNYDLKHCSGPVFGEVVECSGYLLKTNKNSPHRRGYIIPYNYSLNTRKGFKTIYHLMRLSQHDMTTVIRDIIKVRHKGIDVILNACKKIEEENADIVKFLYGGA